MLVKGDRIILTTPMGAFRNVGEVCDVVDVSNNVISFKFGDGMHIGCMSYDEFEKYFEKYEEPKNIANTVTQERIDEIMENSEFIFQTIFDKCTVVACRLPNGFVIVESSACVDPDNYNEEMGVEICSRRIEDKLWELEAYKLQSELWDNDVDFDDNDADYDNNDDILDDDDCDCFWCNRCSQCQ